MGVCPVLRQEGGKEGGRSPRSGAAPGSGCPHSDGGRFSEWAQEPGRLLLLDPREPGKMLKMENQGPAMSVLGASRRKPAHHRPPFIIFILEKYFKKEFLH